MGCASEKFDGCFREKSPDLKLPFNNGLIGVYLMEEFDGI